MSLMENHSINGSDVPQTAEEWRNRRISRTDSGISPIVQEDEDTLTVRRPVTHYSLHPSSTQMREQHDEEAQATMNRYKYYNKLSHGTNDDTLVMPNHIVPSNFYLVLPIKSSENNQSSIITIFSIWNTMMGTSVLSMPWAVQQAGFGLGMALILTMAAICFYTAYRVLNSVEGISLNGEAIEFSDVCRYYLGKWGERVAVIFSLVSLLGAAIVFWVLMSNYLYNSVKFIYEATHGEFNDTMQPISQYHDVVCPNPPHYGNATFLITNTENGHDHHRSFHKWWDQQLTVPFFLVICIFPLINWKSPTFFTKFNSLGAITIAYMIALVIVKTAKWGIHMNFQADKHTEPARYVPEFQMTFPALTGILSLALFIHNCIISITRNSKNPQHNGRDLSIAYICVTCTYLIFGGLFYSAFPLDKRCIEDNLLNNFSSSDIMAFVARICLLFQLLSVFPLVMYIFRIQVLYQLFGSVYPSRLHVVCNNAIIIGFCLVFASLYPKIGKIIGFSGALAGLVYIFTLPSLIYMLSQKYNNSLTWKSIVFHSVLIFLGVANFAGQFFLLGIQK